MVTPGRAFERGFESAAQKNYLYLCRDINEMSNYWNIEGMPHKGWVLKDVFDVREDGQAVDETEYETCMMCNNERIRYVHVVTHPDVAEEFKVGCVCAEKMTNDYVNPKRIE